ncbi:MAG TPA: ATP-dependent zinc metalloprotease FtsH [Terriglobia bacterium]|nr:ATP-dependent zinc metalloprotease FtsH [Terriglobia bacterium]
MNGAPPSGPERPQPGKNQKSPRPNWAGVVISTVVLALLIYAFSSIFRSSPEQKQIPYSQFKQELSQGKIAKINMHGKQVTGAYKSESKGKQKQPPKMFETVLPPVSDPDLMTLIEKNHVTLTAEVQSNSWWTEALIGILPWVLIIGIYVYATRRMRGQMGGGVGGIFGFGRSKAKRYHRGPSDVTFNDVAGLENAKRELQDIIDYLKSPPRYRKIGAKLPRGILLMGPPGTGKTLLAKAVAGEASVPFFSISGSEFVEMFVGVGASRVRDMFENAKKEAPAVIFIDEIDSVGRSRGTGLGGGHDEREQTLNQILSEMDGFSPWHAVIVIAATNRPDVLDPALLRPGRFDRKITMELPRKDARRKILEVHVRKVPLAPDVDLETLAKRTAGFSGADLENMVNEAALLAGRERRDRVSMELLERARLRAALGARREAMLNEEEKWRVAIHESGHAVLACLLPHADPVEQVTIIPRGRALGATEQMPEEDHYNLSESYLRDRIAVMLGGRSSEKLLLGEVSSGAENDLQQATRLARCMVSRWGMSDKLGPVAFHRDEGQVFLGRELGQPRDFSEHTAQMIDDEVRALITDLESQAEYILDQHRAQLEALARKLIEKEVVQADEIHALLSGSGKSAGKSG